MVDIATKDMKVSFINTIMAQCLRDCGFVNIHATPSPEQNGKFTGFTK